MRTQTGVARRTKERKAREPARVLILDDEDAQSIIRERQKLGIDKYDEVWDGVYVMPPLANNPHQKLVGFLTPIYHEVVQPDGQVFPGANVSDQPVNWKKNFRCPDVVVVLPGSILGMLEPRRLVSAVWPLALRRILSTKAFSMRLYASSTQATSPVRHWRKSFLSSRISSVVSFPSFASASSSDAR